jgi:hypothetical protein
MRVFLMAVMCLIACSVCAVDYKVDQRGNFLMVRKEATGGVHMATYAIRMTHISAVTLERADNKYTITITTSLTVPDSANPVQMQYTLESESRTQMENAFNQILDELAKQAAKE